jgi:hypothetical protein
MIEHLENPFPGMNPWMQDQWHSAHARFLTYASDAISPQLPPGLAAITEERLVIEDLRSDLRRGIRPDIAIQEAWTGGTVPSLPAGVAVAEPEIVLLDAPVERSIHIVDGSGNLITAIEVLSRTNKDDERGRRAYRSKQLAYQEGGVNLVEIDLLYSWEQVYLAASRGFSPSLDHPYTVSIWRAGKPDRVFVYRAGWRDRLPVIPIPLRQQDPDAILDLQSVLNETYRKGRYAYLIPYGAAPSRPLPSPEQDWAEQVLRDKGCL